MENSPHLSFESFLEKERPSKTINEEKFYGTYKVAKIVGINVGKIQRMIKDGRLERIEASPIIESTNKRAYFTKENIQKIYRNYVNTSLIQVIED